MGLKGKWALVRSPFAVSGKKRISAPRPPPLPTHSLLMGISPSFEWESDLGKKKPEGEGEKEGKGECLSLRGGEGGGGTAENYGGGGGSYKSRTGILGGRGVMGGGGGGLKRKGLKRTRGSSNLPLTHRLSPPCLGL